MGDGGLEFLREEVRLGARCRVNATTNARCIDFAHCDRLGRTRRGGEGARDHPVPAAHGGRHHDTCINYQTGYQPRLGEHVAWATPER